MEARSIVRSEAPPQIVENLIRQSHSAQNRRNLTPVLWIRITLRIRVDLSPWCGSGFWFLFDADPDPTFHPDADPDPDTSFQIKAQTFEKVLKYILGCHLQIDADPDPAPDSAYNFDADPDFYLMRMRIRMQITKMMRIHNTA